MSKQKSKKKTVPQPLSDVIHDFFDSSINNIKKSRLNKLYNDPKININFNRISETDIKTLLKLKKLNDTQPDVRIILLPRSDINYEELLKLEEDSELKEKSKSKSQEKQGKIVSVKSQNYISIQRKAFVKWINNEFIKKMELYPKLKHYQSFIKNYISLESPYRGVLVYHGLGTGKTATAISTAEGLSSSMDIFTMLPASLEIEFIKEIKKWGDIFFNKEKNNWIFIPISDYNTNDSLKKELYEKYLITPEIITQIHNSVKRISKSDSEKGIWITTDSNDSKSVSGYYMNNTEKTTEKTSKLSEIDKLQIDEQINMLISLKYNFIHYNPFPNVPDVSTKEFYKGSTVNDSKLKEETTDIKKLSNKLYQKLIYNQNKYYVNSPFYNEVIIIDEVHNFVRSIINNRDLSTKFYEWILNAENIKLICLSGTPIINKPSEISILFNMIRGNIKTYNILIKKVSGNITDLELNIKNVLFEENSPVDQINITQKRGVYILSIMKTSDNFSNIMDQETNIIYTNNSKKYTFDEFINFVYDKLHTIFDEDILLPQYKQIIKLTKKDKILLLKGKPKYFDKDLQIPFMEIQRLFSINENESSLDLQDNNVFMDYFFENNILSSKKKTLLKRMMQGLISYYPIDRSAISTMPEILKPLNTLYKDYNISKTINIVPCVMSSLQFERYETTFKKDKIKAVKMNRRNMYSDSTFNYHIRTRQICNIIYNNDSFRYIQKGKNNDKYEQEKLIQYKELINSDSLIGKNLLMYSSKFYKIMENISKFLQGDVPTGKILFYSEFVGDSGADIFESILQVHGYSKYNYKEGKSIDKGKRYTFITGSEAPEEARSNKDVFNLRNNNYGEYIQIMIISKSGAEGISLSCVRQVHIMEPYWNYIRINQVFGRAIRLLSHIGDIDDPLLPLDKRNVEQYLYLTIFPEGDNIESIYNSLQKLPNWPSIPTIESSNISDELFNKYRDVYNIIRKIMAIKEDTFNKTSDQILFEVMEKKYNISNIIIDIVKESSIDCIKNTTDNYKINRNCISYDSKVQNENSYYPGISAETLNKIDKTQFKSKFSRFIKPNIYIVSANVTNKNIFIYYKINNLENKDDIRYIKENGEIQGFMNLENNIFFKFVDSSHKLNDKLGTKFSVYQEMYQLTKQMISELSEDIFPDIKDITNNDNLFGYKIKYNVNDKMLFYPKSSPIIRLYDYDIIEEINFNTSDVKPIIISKGSLYLVN